MANNRDPWGKPEWDAKKRAADQIARDKAAGDLIKKQRLEARFAADQAKAAAKRAANDVKSHRKKK